MIGPQEYTIRIRGALNTVNSLLDEFGQMDRKEQQALLRHKYAQGAPDTIGIARMLEARIKLLNDKFAEEK